MKLSKQGKRKILDNRYWFSEDFVQDDFEGMVCLTIDQAKGLLEIAKDYRMYLFEHCRIPLSLSSNEAFTALREQIAQAEKCNG